MVPEMFHYFITLLFFFFNKGLFVLNFQPILIHDVNGPGCVPVMPELPTLYPGAHNTAFTNRRGTSRWEMRWRDDLADNNPVNAAMMLEMDRFLVDNMEGHIGQHIHLVSDHNHREGVSQKSERYKRSDWIRFGVTRRHSLYRKKTILVCTHERHLENIPQKHPKSEQRLTLH